MDRPDRAAWITSANRIAISRLVDQLDATLSPARSGAYVGRVYVDGVDLEADLDDLNEIVADGIEVRRHGASMRIFRSGAIVAQTPEGDQIEGAGLVPAGSSEHDLMAALEHAPDTDGGPFAGGRIWRAVRGFRDPRMAPGSISEPPEVDGEITAAMGFVRR